MSVIEKNGGRFIRNKSVYVGKDDRRRLVDAKIYAISAADLLAAFKKGEITLSKEQGRSKDGKLTASMGISAGRVQKKLKSYYSFISSNQMKAAADGSLMGGNHRMLTIAARAEQGPWTADEQDVEVEILEYQGRMTDSDKIVVQLQDNDSAKTAWQSQVIRGKGDSARKLLKPIEQMFKNTLGKDLNPKGAGLVLRIAQIVNNNEFVSTLQRGEIDLTPSDIYYTKSEGFLAQETAPTQELCSMLKSDAVCTAVVYKLGRQLEGYCKIFTFFQKKSIYKQSYMGVAQTLLAEALTTGISAQKAERIIKRLNDKYTKIKAQNTGFSGNSSACGAAILQLCTENLK